MAEFLGLHVEPEYVGATAICDLTDDAKRAIERATELLLTNRPAEALGELLQVRTQLGCSGRPVNIPDQIERRACRLYEIIAIGGPISVKDYADDFGMSEGELIDFATSHAWFEVFNGTGKKWGVKHIRIAMHRPRAIHL